MTAKKTPAAKASTATKKKTARRPTRRATPMITPAIAAKFVELIADGETHNSAARLLGFSRSSFTHRESGLAARDPDFAAALDQAQEDGTQRLEREALRRAAEGVDEPVYQGGKKVGTVRKYSDTLLIFLLKARRPDVYRDHQRVEVTGAGGGPIEVQRGVSLAEVAAVLTRAKALPDIDGVATRDGAGADRQALPAAAPVLAEPLPEA